jgi:hypothetical protein
MTMATTNRQHGQEEIWVVVGLTQPQAKQGSSETIGQGAQHSIQEESHPRATAVLNSNNGGKNSQHVLEAICMMMGQARSRTKWGSRETAVKENDTVSKRSPMQR